MNDIYFRVSHSRRRVASLLKTDRQKEICQMALRAKKPEAVKKRLKLFLFGPAGIGKSTAAIQFPNSYIIDSERGTENYDAAIRASGSQVFQTTDMDEVITEVKSLLTEKHEFRTLVIDPVTTLYNALVDKCEAQVGSDFGRHFGAANKTMKRLANLVMALDMNVIVTAHAKKEYGLNMAVLGQTFDAWRQMDYWFDLVIELSKSGKKRVGKVVKTRIASFPDEERFDWSYEAVKTRYEKQYGDGVLDKESEVVEMASSDQLRTLRELLETVKLPEGTAEKWLTKAQADRWEDVPAATVDKCIAYVQARMPKVLEGSAL
jgi:hypothetical protein